MAHDLNKDVGVRGMRVFRGFIEEGGEEQCVHITKVHWSRYKEGVAVANAWQNSTKGAGRWECTIEYEELED